MIARLWFTESNLKCLQFRAHLFHPHSYEYYEWKSESRNDLRYLYASSQYLLTPFIAVNEITSARF